MGATLAALPVDALGDVVVVDNASTDGTADAVQLHRSVRLLRSARNVGFGAGCNAGVSALHPDVDLVLFLNPDAVVERSALERLATYLDRVPACALVGARLERDGEPLPSAGTPASLMTELRLVAPAPVARRMRARRFDGDYDRSGPVGYVEGACFMARRSVLESIGGFDERFFLFYEELDLAHRVRALGFTVDLCADAVASHRVGGSRATLSDHARSHLLHSAELYLRKWHGTPAMAAFRATRATTAAVRSLRRRPSRPRRGRHAA